MRLTLAAALAATLAALPAGTALAAEPEATAAKPDEPVHRPVTSDNVSAGDVITTPVSDLNLKKKKVPQLLQTAEQQPYALTGLNSCQALATSVGELDAVLGDDIDLPPGEAKRPGAGRVAQEAVGAFIPFRGLIREVSGANSRARALQSAISAGIARRAFLKGVGEARGCTYPARSATAEVIAARTAPGEQAAPQPAQVTRAAAVDAPKPGPPQARRSVEFVANPVVQRTN